MNIFVVPESIFTDTSDFHNFAITDIHIFGNNHTIVSAGITCYYPAVLIDPEAVRPSGVSSDILGNLMRNFKGNDAILTVGIRR